MWITKLPHAGMIIGTKKARVAFDLLITPNLLEGIFSLRGELSLNFKNLANYFDAVFISHSHKDHFDIPSLNLLSRETPIYYPGKDPLIPNILFRMGFQKLFALKSPVPVLIGDMSITPTPSDADFPEYGFVVKSKNRSIWNLVDTAVRKKNAADLLRRHGRPDLLFAFYQPIQERSAIDLSFTNFPLDHYQLLVNLVKELNPKYVVPSSCDFLNTAMPWMNSYFFPIRKKQFLQHVKSINKSIRGITLEPGESFHFDSHGARAKYRNATPELEIVWRNAKDYDWNPTVGMPPLDDFGAHLVPDIGLSKEVDKLLRGLFIHELEKEWRSDAVAELRTAKIKWHLRILFSEKEPLDYYFDFGKKRAWLKAPPEEIDFQTTIGAGSLLAWSRAIIGEFAITSGGLMRAYDRRVLAKDGKISLPPIKAKSFEPLTTVLRKKFFFQRLEWMLKKTHAKPKDSSRRPRQ